MFNSLKLKLSAVATFISRGVTTLANKFNVNVTAPNIAEYHAHPALAPQRVRGFRTGIKGIAGTNNTKYGDGLRAYFIKFRAMGVA